MNLDHSLQAVRDIFNFPFRDPKWQEKLLIGSALMFGGFIIPILPWLVVLGYMARLMRAGERNSDPSVLPEWTDWGDLFMDGLRQFGVSFLIGLPVAAVILVGQGIYLVTLMGTTNRGGFSGGAANGMALLVAMLVFFVSIGLGTVLGIGSWLLMPPAMAHVAVRREFSAFFRVGEWWRILRANLGGFLATLFFIAGMYVVMMFGFQILYMTIILCLAIPLLIAPVSFFVMVVYARLTGQAYGAGQRKLNQIAEPATPEAAPVVGDPAI
jgi:hypothetical protein